VEKGERAKDLLRNKERGDERKKHLADSEWSTGEEYCEKNGELWRLSCLTFSWNVSRKHKFKIPLKTLARQQKKGGKATEKTRSSNAWKTQTNRKGS